MGYPRQSSRNRVFRPGLTQGMAVEIDRAGIGESKQRQRLVAQPVQVERAFRMLIHQAAGTANKIDGVAHHLGTHARGLFPQLLARKVVKGEPVPAARLLNQQRQRIAHLRRRFLECAQTGGLLHEVVKEKS
jgi:hypothetical protein